MPPLTKPRRLWRCHAVAFISSARVAPWGRRIKARIFAPLLPTRSGLTSVPLAGFAAFWLAMAFFLDATALALPLASLRPWGAPRWGLAVFVEEGFSCPPPTS